MVSARRVGVIVATVASTVILVGWITTLLMDPAGEGANGAGFTYRGEFYGLSGAEVRPERLGEVLDQDVMFQDTTVEVRTITGIDVDTAVAAFVTVSTGEPGEPEQAWFLLSPDPELAADPWSEPDLAAAVEPDP